MTTQTTIVDMGDMEDSKFHGRQSQIGNDHSVTSSLHDQDRSLSSSAEGSSRYNGTNNNSDNGRSSQVTGSSGHNTGEHIFARDGGALSGARCCFVLVLLATACALAVVVNVIFTNEQTGDFESQFDDVAVQIIDTANVNAKRVFHSLEVLSLTATSMIKEVAKNNQTYPDGFFTMPDAETHLGPARQSSGATVVGYTPIVKDALEYALWETYSSENIGWVEESYQSSAELSNNISHIGDWGTNTNLAVDFFNPSIWYIQKYDTSLNKIVIDEQTAVTCPATSDHNEGQNREPYSHSGAVNPNNGPFAPIWVESPPPHPNEASNINFNLMEDPIFRLATKVIEETKMTTFLYMCPSASTWFQPGENGNQLYSLVVTPAWNDHGEKADVVGHFFATVPWATYLENVHNSQNDDVVDVVLRSQCGGMTISYLLAGSNITLLSQNDDVHVRSQHYEDMAYTANLATFSYQEDDDDAAAAAAAGAIVNEDTGEILCSSTTFTITVYPTEEFEQNYTSYEPLAYTVIVLSIFFFTMLAFFLFDCLVQRRQSSIINTAMRQNVLVSSLFPKNIQKQLMEDIEADIVKNKTGKAGLRSYLNNEAAELEEAGLDVNPKSKPIADLFPETTIMFADIAGFTAWSSTREPSAVFTLLEAIYGEFDSIAKRRRVFKVEVVGDCYVAVAGLPDPRPDHAVVMAKFANDCLHRMFTTVRKLEVELGPDTAELGLRVGLHSGPVVAGVLRGDKSRFQLFGDTMNTASRMESTGVPGRIQISQDTADLLQAAEKGHWLTEREVKIAAKGKGELQTFFLQIDGGVRSMGSCTGSVTSSEGLSDDQLNIPDPGEVMERRNRVAEWTVEVMAQQLKSIVEMRKSQGVQPYPAALIRKLEKDSLSQKPDNKTVIDEVAECIKLPDCSQSSKKNSKSDVSEITLSSIVMEELRSYVQTIASLYNENPFHNFDHANHVVMSVNKLLSRINAPDLDECTAQEIHDHTYGITSDPLTWFACVFSALIHDVDHSGVPNAQLVKERTPTATLYDAKSVAEQNSFDIAWDLLMEPSYDNLRQTIYVNEAEFKRFRQLVVNSVMATDIVDKDLKTLRNNRWDAAFDDSKAKTESHARLLKATIVIEHLIQASDVAHTMQHWHIYRRWNERFFKECYQAFLDGRADSDPAENWYKGEIGFFDFYIIPLAKKLQSCGVFGVSSDEYLSYAMQNRKEWEERGEEMVKAMVRNVRSGERNDRYAND